MKADTSHTHTHTHKECKWQISPWKDIQPHGLFVCVCVLSHVRLFSTPWTVGSSVHGISQARILKWVAISSSRWSSRPKDQTCMSCVSCIGRQILDRGATWEAPHCLLGKCKSVSQWSTTTHLIRVLQLKRWTIVEKNLKKNVYICMYNWIT